jgi:hypothetical protein
VYLLCFHFFGTGTARCGESARLTRVWAPRRARRASRSCTAYSSSTRPSWPRTRHPRPRPRGRGDGERTLRGCHVADARTQHDAGRMVSCPWWWCWLDSVRGGNDDDQCYGNATPQNVDKQFDKESVPSRNEGKQQFNSAKGSRCGADSASDVTYSRIGERHTMADEQRKERRGQSRHIQAMTRNHQQHRAMEVMALRSVREPCRSTALSRGLRAVRL